MKSRNFIKQILLYLALLIGSAIFLLPLFWMVLSSLKSEREIFDEAELWQIELPVPAISSPFIEVKSLHGNEKANMDLMAPLIAENINYQQWKKNKMANLELDKAMILSIFRKISRRISVDEWNDSASLKKKVTQGISKDLLNEVFAEINRELKIAKIRVRSNDLIEYEVPVSNWQIVNSANAKLDNQNDNSLLSYSFAENSFEVVELTSTLKLPFSGDGIKNIQIPIGFDNSWHKLYFSIETKGKSYHTKSPEYTGIIKSNWKTVILQVYGTDDESNKAKIWTTLYIDDKKNDQNFADNEIKITIRLEKSSRLRAIWAKCSYNFVMIFANMPFWRYTFVSLFLVMINIVGMIFSSSISAYALTRLDWPGKKMSLILLLSTMMIPTQVTMIPTFLIMKYLGFYNTLTPLWIMSFTGSAFNIFLLIQFMKGIPRDLEDAAKIDGCNVWQTYYYVILPLLKMPLCCVGIFTFIAVWNDFMGPLIYLNDQRLYPLSLGLYALNVQMEASYGLMMAGSLLMTLPVIILFAFTQRFFITGITMTGIKG